jgi:hypothetical protein
VFLATVLNDLVTTGSHPPDDPWPVLFWAVAAVIFVGLIAAAATIANRRDRVRGSGPGGVEAGDPAHRKAGDHVS